MISITFRWIEQHFTDLTNLEQEVALLAVARAPNEAEMSFKNSFISSLPEAVRCRLNTGRDLDSAALSRDERLRLATSRIDLLLAEDPSNINYAYFQEEFARMRDAALTFLKGAPHPKAAAPELISSAFDVIQRVIHSSEKREGYPLTTIDLIYDQLLTPVAMCYADRQHAERARELFDYACKVLVISKNVTKNKVAAYRVLLTALEQGVPFDEAEAQATEALGQAYKVDEKVAGAKMGEGLFK